MATIRFLCVLMLIVVSLDLSAQDGAFSIPGTLEDETAESLSEMIRERAAEMKTELEEDEPTDLLRSDTDVEADNLNPEDVETTFDEADEDDADAEKKRAESTQMQLIELNKPVTAITLGVGSDADAPADKAAQFSEAKSLLLISSLGAAPPVSQRYTVGFRHRPLYFEEKNLERCGKSFGVFQNAVSGIRFLANTMCLPYRMGEQRPDCTILSPGDCPTCHSYAVDCNPFPLSHHGLLSEAAAAAGFTFLLL